MRQPATATEISLASHILDRIKALDAEDKKETERYFGVNRATINRWKKTKQLDFAAAEAFFANELVPTAEVEELMPEIPVDENALVDPSIHVEERAGHVPRVVAGSAVRPSGGPRVIQPRVGTQVRHSGLEMAHPTAQAGGFPVTGAIEGGPAGAPNDMLALFGQFLKMMQGAGGGAPAVPASPFVARTLNGDPVHDLPGGTIAFKPGYGSGWNRPHKPAGQ